VPAKEITYYNLDNPYYYPPYYLFYTKEMGDTLSENSVTVFNVGQNQEDNIPVVCKIFKKDNAGGYTLEDSFYNTVSSLPAGDSATVSFADSWAPDKRGSYLVTYYTALSTDELPSDDTASGYLFVEKNEFTSPWTDSPPTCDGIIGTGEWSDAALLDVSKFAVPQPLFEIEAVVGPHFYESDATILYVKNDSDYLYLAFDLLADSSNTVGDWVSVGIDDNGNRFFDSDSSEGTLSLRNDYLGLDLDDLNFLPLLSASDDSFVNETGNQVSITDWDFGVKSSDMHQQAEIRIPFGSNPKSKLNSGPGKTIYVWVGTADAGDLYIHNGFLYANEMAYWPWQGIFYYFPQKLAQIHLSASPTGLPEEESEKIVTNNFRLQQNYPNPFNPSTVINYQLTYPARVEVNIYNILGQKIKNLVDGFRVKGNHSVVWDGKDQNGKEVASGIYFYKIIAGDHTSVRKMVLLK
jgi:hypothetical protein